MPGNQGFASMDTDRVKQIAALGGLGVKEGELPVFGHEAGDARKEQIASDAYSKLGKMGGGGVESHNESSNDSKEEHGNQGFASMDPERVHEIAVKGGEARKQQLISEGYAEMGRKAHE